MFKLHDMFVSPLLLIALFTLCISVESVFIESCGKLTAFREVLFASESPSVVE